MDAKTRQQLLVLAKQLAEAGEALQAVIDGNPVLKPKQAGCGCRLLTFHRDYRTNDLIVVCDKGRETRLSLSQISGFSPHPQVIIEYLAHRVAAAHTLDEPALIRKLQEAESRRTGPTIQIEV